MTFNEELKDLINRHSIETGSNTPDYILVEFLTGCLREFDHAVRLREVRIQPEAIADCDSWLVCYCSHKEYGHCRYCGQLKEAHNHTI